MTDLDQIITPRSPLLAREAPSDEEIELWDEAHSRTFETDEALKREANVWLDPKPFRNRLDGSRWQDNGGDPDLLPFRPQAGYSQNESDYAESTSEKDQNR
jgi:hypothetical protein